MFSRSAAPASVKLFSARLWSKRCAGKREKWFRESFALDRVRSTGWIGKHKRRRHHTRNQQSTHDPSTPPAQPPPTRPRPESLNTPHPRPTPQLFILRQLRPQPYRPHQPPLEGLQGKSNKCVNSFSPSPKSKQDVNILPAPQFGNFAWQQRKCSKLMASVTPCVLHVVVCGLLQAPPCLRESVCGRDTPAGLVGNTLLGRSRHKNCKNDLDGQTWQELG